MDVNEHNAITEEEAELYDRQIRLWGAGVQRSLRNTRVLVIGIRGVATEICKNLILSGVKSLTMMDPENVNKEDLNSQYFLYPGNIGENRAQASLKAAQILNPNVKVTAETCSIQDKPLSYLSNFDVVCVTKHSPALTVCINEMCKFSKVKFFCGDSFGMFGYLFEDLNENDKSVSFATALNFKWTPMTSLKKRKYEDPSYLVFKILTEFRTKVNRDPSMNFEQNDRQILLNLRDLVIKKFDVQEDILPLEYLDNVFGEYGPTCSIIGGMIAQEIIKSLSKDSTSSYKLYLFNHLLCQMAGIYLHKDVSKFVEKQIASKGQEEDVIEL